jgi:hypothetical protein
MKPPDASQYKSLNNFVTFRRLLKEKFDFSKYDEIYYEHVNRHIGVIAAHMYGGYMAILAEACIEHAKPMLKIEVKHLKRYFADHGLATKQNMFDTCVDEGFNPYDENEADAIAMGMYVIEKVWKLEFERSDYTSTTWTGRPPIRPRPPVPRKPK